MTTSQEAPEVTLAPTTRGIDVANAARFGIAVATALDPSRWQLSRVADCMTLRAPDACGGISVSLELRFGPLATRLRSSRRTDPLPKACGVGRRDAPLRVLDAMAGLGRDAMVLAQLGCLVTAVERVPALAFLVHDAIAATALATRLTVVSARAEDWLQTTTDRPEVIYLDPMFATPGRAQVKKDMQLCRLLAGPPDDPLPLFELARARASERVVVKRHHGGPPLGGEPDFAVAGERVRFDVYLTAR